MYKPDSFSSSGFLLWFWLWPSVLLQAEIVSFLGCPSVEKLLQLGELRTDLSRQVGI